MMGSAVRLNKSPVLGVTYLDAAEHKQSLLRGLHAMTRESYYRPFLAKALLREAWLRWAG